MVWIVLAAVLVFFGILPTMVMSYVIFTVLLVRTKPEKWARACSMPEDEEIVRVYDAALFWRDAHEACRQDVSIQNDGLKLCGEYYDFGSDKTVILLPGRMEACVYACFFAEPYRRAGYNVLTADSRAHGLSQGKYNSVGYREYRDVLAWGKWLHEEKGAESIVLHGICIGANAALLAMTDDACPAYFRGLVVEGMFTNFYESMRNHMKTDGRPIFPFLYEVMLYMRVIMGVRPMTDGPYKRIAKLQKPILFLHGKQDAFSLPEKAEELYALCRAPKKLVWYEKGGHSRLRINNLSSYDDAIASFLPTLGASEPTAR